MMIFWALLPFVTFLILMAIEAMLAPAATPGAMGYSRTDIWLNAAGLGVQGVVVPLLSFGVGHILLPQLLPNSRGILPLGFGAAFCLSFIGVDLLYYWQHRAFHEIKALWPLHLTHHATPHLDIWATSRNCLMINGLFVFFLVNPWLGYLCRASDGFFAGAMLTATLDIWRHTRLTAQLNPLKGWLTRPIDHHRHHDALKPAANFGANFMLWDRLFGTADLEAPVPEAYAVAAPDSFWQQFLTPWKTPGDAS